uniref:Uncharacterized protein n=1 Tax=Oryza glumipatula TaxID=40148 RepID=A0A0D9ZUV0_9ORYZ
MFAAVDLQLDLAGRDGDGHNWWLWPAIAKREDGRNEDGYRVRIQIPVGDPIASPCMRGCGAVAYAWSQDEQRS